MLSEEEQACRPHSGLGGGGGLDTRQPQDHNLREASAAGRVSGLTKAAKTRFWRAGRCKSPQQQWPRGTGSQLPNPDVGGGVWTLLQSLDVAGTGPARSHHHSNESLLGPGALHCLLRDFRTPLQRPGLTMTTKALMSRRGPCVESGERVGSRVTLATLMGRVVTIPRKRSFGVASKTASSPLQAKDTPHAYHLPYCTRLSLMLFGNHVPGFLECRLKN